MRSFDTIGPNPLTTPIIHASGENHAATAQRHRRGVVRRDDDGEMERRLPACRFAGVLACGARSRHVHSFTGRTRLRMRFRFRVTLRSGESLRTFTSACPVGLPFTCLTVLRFLVI